MTTDNKNLIQRFGEVYGRHAFGVISLLIIWYAIVDPQLERMRVDFEANKQVIQQLSDVIAKSQEASRTMQLQQQKTSLVMQETSRTMQATALVMSSTVETLERIIDKTDNRSIAASR